eukprot:TRINITY_DN17608_c0_g1_i5.p1 TRINITY_DN17608_c0_g1~~TRINITY_DN17608_c0_g1_i5.p1  ORF type:complete len:138 (-),score=36.18 TRINITY_DN17608_c0_g1_i5:498-911(-)
MDSTAVLLNETVEVVDSVDQDDSEDEVFFGNISEKEAKMYRKDERFARRDTVGDEKRRRSHQSCTSSSSSTALQTSPNLPPPANKPAAAAPLTNANNPASRRADFPKAEDFYAIYQQHKRKHSSPAAAPVNSNGNST